MKVIEMDTTGNDYPENNPSDQIGYSFSLDPGSIKLQTIAAKHIGVTIQSPAHEIKGTLNAHHGGFISFSKIQ